MDKNFIKSKLEEAQKGLKRQLDEVKYWAGLYAVDTSLTDHLGNYNKDMGIKEDWTQPIKIADEEFLKYLGKSENSGKCKRAIVQDFQHKYPTKVIATAVISRTLDRVENAGLAVRKGANGTGQWYATEYDTDPWHLTDKGKAKLAGYGPETIQQQPIKPEKPNCHSLSIAVLETVQRNPGSTPKEIIQILKDEGLPFPNLTQRVYTILNNYKITKSFDVSRGENRQLRYVLNLKGAHQLTRLQNLKTYS